MKQDCSNLELYIDEELDTECAVQFETHLLTCERCQRELEYLQATIQGIKSYPPDKTVYGYSSDQGKAVEYGVFVCSRFCPYFYLVMKGA